MVDMEGLPLTKVIGKEPSFSKPSLPNSQNRLFKKFAAAEQERVTIFIGCSKKSNLLFSIAHKILMS